MRKNLLGIFLCALPGWLAAQTSLPVQAGPYDLVFPDLARSWDEGMPLGNATLGSLVWQKDSALRLSLDRVDLWDLRPMENLQRKEFSYDWIYQQVMKKDYKPVQQLFDVPYDQEPAPSKIPGAALEFPLEQAGAVKSVHLFLQNALCEVQFQSGMRFQTFVHASRPVGWFIVENAPASFVPVLVPPVYKQAGAAGGGGPVDGLSLTRLGYKQGQVQKGIRRYSYHQQGWGGFYYDVAVAWKWQGRRLIGAWSISSSLVKEKAGQLVQQALQEAVSTAYASHQSWWQRFWSRSAIQVPDPVLEKQYYNEIYKLGCVARSDSYPISLQAVWTADNGKLPPWKGDYHNDLNTQLSYWPVYAGNYLSEGMGYLNTLFRQQPVNEKYTKRFFGKEGLAVPGVCTLTGEPMGGWIQYSLSPTVSSWLAQHFYLQWKFSADRHFLQSMGYPYLRQVATFLENITVLRDGVRTLRISSSPEIYDNSLRAWFHTLTNYDLSLMEFAWRAASEMADSLKRGTEAAHWESLWKQLPSFDLDSGGALSFAHGFPYNVSHRHFSNLMAIHPLGLIDWSQGAQAQSIIRASLHRLDSIGPANWCGYSYAWEGNLKARARDGEGAEKALRIFAECFCLRNTFHANGDQSGTGKSNFTYRPFTLEGNFAFAAGMQEMLLQSQTGIIDIFPAVPDDWKEISFKTLRARGAFLVSAYREKGHTTRVTILAEKGGLLRLHNPFAGTAFKITGAAFREKEGILYIPTRPGQEITLHAEG